MLPFVLSLSKHEHPFDKLRANGGYIYSWEMPQLLFKSCPLRSILCTYNELKNGEKILFSKYFMAYPTAPIATASSFKEDLTILT